MATYGLYDCELWHRGKTMPNLELMKVYNYHHSRGEIVRLLRPQDNTSTYTKVIYFKETDAELPKTLEVYGDNKDFYGYGFYKTFIPLDEIYTDTPPSYTIYEPYEDKFKISYSRFFKKGSFIRLENEDFSGYNPKSSYIFVADHNVLSLPKVEDFLQSYKKQNIYFCRGASVNNINELKIIYPYRNIIKNKIILQYPLTEEIVKNFHEVYIPIDKPLNKETNEQYLIRVVNLALYFKIHNKLPYLINVPTAPKEAQWIIKWITNSNDSFNHYYALNPPIMKWLQQQNSELRNLLKTKPSNFTEQDFQWKYILNI